MKKIIMVIPVIVFLLLAIYTVVIGWPERKGEGWIYACHGIPLTNSGCIGYKTVWVIIN